MSRTVAFALTVAAGALIAFQPGMNARLSQRSSPLVAICVTFVVATVVLLLAVAVTGQGGVAHGLLLNAPPLYLASGLLGVFLVMSMVIALPTVGTAGAVVATVSGQLILSTLLDRFGAFGTDPVPLSLHRLAGVALLILGAALVVAR